MRAIVVLLLTAALLTVGCGSSSSTGSVSSSTKTSQGAATTATQPATTTGAKTTTTGAKSSIPTLKEASNANKLVDVFRNHLVAPDAPEVLLIQPHLTSIIKKCGGETEEYLAEHINTARLFLHNEHVRVPPEAYAAALDKATPEPSTAAGCKHAFTKTLASFEPKH